MNTSRRRLAGLLAVAFALLLIAACRGAGQAPRPRVTIRVATGLPGGSFRPLSIGILEGLKARLAEFVFVAVDTPGSDSNLESLQSGTADIGLAYSDGAYRAHNEELRGVEHADAARAIAVLQPATIHVIVRHDSDIKTVRDLKGRRIASGAAGTGTAYTSEIVLRFFGIAAADAHVHRLSFKDSVEALLRGQVDAAFVLSADPAEAIRSATDAGARLIAIDGIDADRLLTEYPFFRRMRIPARTYANLAAPVETVAVDTLLMCRRELGDETVRSLTEAVLQLLPELAVEITALRTMDLARAPAASVPLHPGAVLFYREAELTR